MIKTARATTVSSLGTQFDAFLFAPIGEEKNGMSVSVVSALARLGLDPWREAAELSHLPKETANRRLASLIEALPTLTGPEAKTTCARLVALLPRVADSHAAWGEKFANADVMPSFRAFVLVVLLNLFIVAAMMGAERVAASLHGSPDVGESQSMAASSAHGESPPRGRPSP